MSFKKAFFLVGFLAMTTLIFNFSLPPARAYEDPLTEELEVKLLKLQELIEMIREIQKQLDELRKQLDELIGANIKVVSPNGGEQWVKGKTYQIKWTSASSIKKVTIILLEGNQEIKRYEGISNNGTYSWTISQDINTGSNYKIDIVDFSDINIYDQSDNYFSIVPVECVGEGEKGNYFTGIKCCPGLTQIANSQPTNTGLCVAPTDGSFVCSYCGNGVCGSGENICNCSQDCKAVTTCTDSDGGRDYYVKGWVQDSYDTKPFYDYCTLNGAEVSSCTDVSQNCGIIEKYCAANNRRSGHYLQGGAFDSVCPYGCRDGACLSEPAIEPKCTDSDGENIYEKGKKYGVLENGKEYEVYDTCVFYYDESTSSGAIGKTVYGCIGDNCKLQEQICWDSLTPGVKDMTCPNGCQDGVCLSEPLISTCTDSDGGKDYYVKGDTVGMAVDNVISIDTDSCKYYQGSPDWLVEWFCLDSGYRTNTNYQCPHGCSDGACQPGITIVSPNGGETFKQGENITITWNSSGINYIDIDLLDWGREQEDGSVPFILDLATNYFVSGGTYTWKIYSDWPTGDLYKIRVKDMKEGSISDQSDNYFSIVSNALGSKSIKSMGNQLASLTEAVSGLIEQLKTLMGR